MSTTEPPEADVSQPPAPHPTAKAFFDALDSKSQSSKQSESLKRRSQSLGWRNRYSQDDYYPVVVKNNQQTTGADNDDERRSISFSVQQIQRGEVEGTYGTGATVWPAAMVLIKYLERHQSELMVGKNVLDLGSGTGVTSIAAATLGACHVTCTDGEDPVVRLASENVQHAAKQINTLLVETNKPLKSDDGADEPSGRLDDAILIDNCPIVVQKYWWGDSNHLPPVPSYDVVLVADCVLPKLYPIAPLVQAIDEMLSASLSHSSSSSSSASVEKKNPVAILSYEHRYYPHYDPRDKFRELAKERNLNVILVDPSELDPIYSVDDIEIWQVTKQL